MEIASYSRKLKNNASEGSYLHWPSNSFPGDLVRKTVGNHMVDAGCADSISRSLTALGGRGLGMGEGGGDGVSSQIVKRVKRQASFVLKFAMSNKLICWVQGECYLRSQ